MALNADVISTRPPIRVLIVDDTRTIRMLIRALLSKDPRISVVGEAGDPYEARDMIKALRPDVLTLDVEMPRMNGLVFLEKIMRLRPMPVIMVSTRTAEQSDAAIKALSLGALDCIDLKRLQAGDPRVADLADTVAVAAEASIRKPAEPVAAAEASSETCAYEWSGKYVVVGSSTGGVEALMQVFSSYPENGPPVVVAQHMPAPFLESFARRLDSNCRGHVRLAQDGDFLRQGEILVGPGGRHHVTLKGRERPRIFLQPDDGQAMYVPCVDYLFKSAVPLGSNAVAVMLTGMGRDGATAMLDMRNAGAHTIAQSPETVVVDGMPKAARDRGAVMDVVHLSKICRRILQVTGKGQGT